MAYSLAGFNGQRPDPVSGHYHPGNGYRACSPVLGRFTAPDSWSPFGEGGINPYAYCVGDPVNRADPSGHFSLGQGIGMALGFVAGIALSILTEGAAMPVALTLMATVAGDAAIGAGAELATETIDGQRISWGQVGLAAGMSAGASLAGFGLGRLSKLKGTSNRPFGGLMIEGATGGRGTIGGAVQERSWEKTRQYIANKDNFIHRIADENNTDMEPYQMESFDLKATDDNSFTNIYKKDEWIFQGIRRNDKNVPYFLSDVIRYQYESVAIKYDFLNTMPKRVIMEGVANDKTLRMTQGKTGQELFSAYFQTPNGEATKRILDQFKLTAIGIESHENQYINVYSDYIIDLR